MGSGSIYDLIEISNDISDVRAIFDYSNKTEVRFDPFEFRLNDFENIELYLKQRFCIGSYFGEKSILIQEGVDIDLNTIPSDYKFYRCSKKVFDLIMVRNFSKQANFLSLNIRQFLYPKSSAQIFQKFIPRLIISLFFAATIVFSIISPIAYYVANFVYFINSFVKFYLFNFAVLRSEEKLLDSKIDLPVYSVLVPLYREASKVGQIYDNISKLDYPHDKLDVKFIVEEDDKQTRKALGLLELDNRFQVITVPFSELRTKPRACNYALSFARGEYVTIYDAEDEPDSDQLTKSAKKFATISDDYVCLQARLRIKNNGNLLCKFFLLEYEMLFGFFLKSLFYFKLPIPLGGTSNHFKTAFLKDIGMWDPYNVTEDAELGIKISSMGYRVGMLDSYTLEEGHVSIKSWMKQRIRWTKGFMITLASYLLSKKKNMRFIDKLSVIVFVGFSVVSFTMAPAIIFSGIFWGASTQANIISGVNLVIYFSLFSAICMSLIKNEDVHGFSNITTMLIFPLYFFLHSIAAYFAIFEVLFSPFRWNKTDHF